MTFSKYLFSIILMVIISITACSQNDSGKIDSVDYSPLDLKYINDEANKLVKSYNDKNGTNWNSLDADFRILVHKCTTPLKAEWSTAPDYHSLPDKKYLYITVICDKSVYKDQSWDVLVLTNRPKI